MPGSNFEHFKHSGDGRVSCVPAASIMTFSVLGLGTRAEEPVACDALKQWQFFSTNLTVRLVECVSPYLVVALDPHIRESSVQHGRNEVVADTFHLSCTTQGITYIGGIKKQHSTGSTLRRKQTATQANCCHTHTCSSLLPSSRVGATYSRFLADLRAQATSTTSLALRTPPQPPKAGCFEWSGEQYPCRTSVALAHRGLLKNRVSNSSHAIKQRVSKSRKCWYYLFIESCMISQRVRKHATERKGKGRTAQPRPHLGSILCTGR